LGEIVRAVDGPIAPIPCVTEAPREQCSPETICALRDVWAEVRDAVSAIVDHTTLAEICERIEARTKDRLSYQI